MSSEQLLEIQEELLTTLDYEELGEFINELAQKLQNKNPNLILRQNSATKKLLKN